MAAITGVVAVLSYLDAESNPVRADYTTAVVAFAVAVLALLGAVAMRVGRKDDEARRWLVELYQPVTK